MFFFFSVRNRILYLSPKMKDMSCLVTTLKAIFTYLCRNVVNLNQMTSDIRTYFRNAWGHGSPTESSTRISPPTSPPRWFFLKQNWFWTMKIPESFNTEQRWWRRLLVMKLAQQTSHIKARYKTTVLYLMSGAPLCCTITLSGFVHKLKELCHEIQPN